MEPVQVEAIKQCRDILGELATGVKPRNNEEWKTLKIIVDVHEKLRGIEYSKLGQIPMPAPEPEETCPMCEGRCTIADGTGAQAICPKCDGKGKVQTSQLQESLPEPAVAE